MSSPSSFRSARTAWCSLVALAVAQVLSQTSAIGGQQQRYAAVLDGILAAWKTADVVCLGEDHGRQFDSDLRIGLVRHPAFPRIVRVIVIEFANPIHQDLLDRFIVDGVAMPREELAPIWRDASGAEVWESPIYEQFLRAVQDVNRELHRGERVRVVGGDSKIDWGRIVRAEDLVPLVNRGGNIREIIANQVLEPHLKGLAIYGAGHCQKVGSGFPGELALKFGADRFWSIWPLVGEKGAAKGRAIFGLGDEPSYIVVKGTSRAGMPAIELLGEPNVTLGDAADALIYHGSVPDRAVPADLSGLKSTYGSEMERRRRLIIDALALWQKRG